MEVLTREKCVYFDCDEGKDTGKRKSNKTFEKCEVCNGKGYIEKWMDVGDVARSVIFIGGR